MSIFSSHSNYYKKIITFIIRENFESSTNLKSHLSKAGDIGKHKPLLISYYTFAYSIEHSTSLYFCVNKRCQATEREREDIPEPRKRERDGCRVCWTIKPARAHIVHSLFGVGFLLRKLLLPTLPSALKSDPVVS